MGQSEKIIEIKKALLEMAEALRSPNLRKYYNLYSNNKCHLNDEKSRQIIQKYFEKISKK